MSSTTKPPPVVVPGAVVKVVLVADVISASRTHTFMVSALVAFTAVFTRV
jgi:hypothetical protein